MNRSVKRPSRIDPTVHLLDSIHQIQLRFIEDAVGGDAFKALLAILLDLSDSEYGFIAKILRQNDKPYLKVRIS